jgi:hypothetical protein
MPKSAKTASKNTTTDRNQVLVQNPSASAKVNRAMRLTKGSSNYIGDVLWCVATMMLGLVPVAIVHRSVGLFDIATLPAAIVLLATVRARKITRAHRITVGDVMRATSIETSKKLVIYLRVWNHEVRSLAKSTSSSQQVQDLRIEMYKAAKALCRAGQCRAQVQGHGPAARELREFYDRECSQHVDSMFWLTQLTTERLDEVYDRRAARELSVVRALATVR